MKPSIVRNPTANDNDIVIDVGGISYRLNVLFVNESGQFKLQNSSFVQLEFEDNVFNPILCFRLTVVNTNSEVESSIFTSPQGINEQINFQIQGNGDEFVVIDLEPLTDSNAIPELRFGPKLSCFILNERSYHQQGKTYKTFELVDAKYRDLFYTTQTWSTVDLLGNNVTQLSDADRSVFTGDAIQNLLARFMGTQFIDQTRWDRGAFKTFYTSSQGETPIEILNYLLGEHVSSKSKLPCLLRENKRGELNLQGLDDIYAGVGDRLLGPDIIGTFSLPSSNYNQGGTQSAGLESPWNTAYPVTRYHYLNPACDSATPGLTNNETVGYDFASGQFQIHRSAGESTHALNVYEQQILSKLPGRNTLSFRPGENTLQRRLYTTSYSNSAPEQVSVESRNEILRNTLLLSGSLEFETQGNVNLRSGKFVNMSRETNIRSEFERKLQGLYFVVDTHHVINNTEYNVTAIAVKPQIHE